MLIFMTLAGSLLPAILLLVGWLLRFRPPRKISWYAGYRTARSMKSQEAWDYAQRRLGQLWRAGSLPMLCLSLLPVFFSRDASEDFQAGVLLLLMTIQLAGVLAVIPIIEKELSEKGL